MRRQNQPFPPRQSSFGGHAASDGPASEQPRAAPSRVPSRIRTHAYPDVYDDDDDDDDRTERKIQRQNSYGFSVQSPGVPRSTSILGQIWYKVRTTRPRRWRSRFRAFLLFLVLALLVDAWMISRTRARPTRTKAEQIQGATKPRIFIAGIHRNNELILRSHWNAAVLDLVRFYGPENIYISLYESGSLEDTKGALRELDMELSILNVRRSVELDPIDQIIEVGRSVLEKEDDWIFTPRGKFELRRIPYLANLRNRVMARLYAEANEGRKYDIVLWLNDVVFTTEDITTLLATNDGHYDAVCSMDYNHAHEYYDTFALRNIQGFKVQTTWPYFSDAASSNRLMNLQPIPVSSCWNGVVAFPSAPFYESPVLQFRGAPDSLASHHLEGSECCLIHADNNGTRAGKGVWLNPNVRVAYDGSVYAEVNPQNGVWPGAQEKVMGYWRSRFHKLTAWPRKRLEDTVVGNRVAMWIAEEEAAGRSITEPAAHCLINEMQVLEEAGWRHL